MNNKFTAREVRTKSFLFDEDIVRIDVAAGDIKYMVTFEDDTQQNRVKAAKEIRAWMRSNRLTAKDITMVPIIYSPSYKSRYVEITSGALG